MTENFHLYSSPPEQRDQAEPLALWVRLCGAQGPPDAGDSEVDREGPDERRPQDDQPGQEGSRPDRRTGFQDGD